MNTIKNWFVGNGTLLNTVYGAVFLFIFLSFYMSLMRSDALAKKKRNPDSESTGDGLFILVSIFAIPSVLLYAFDGMAEGNELLTLSPMPFSELLWFHKIILIAFGILFVVFFLVVFCIERDHLLFWNVMSMDGVIVLLCTIFMLLERGVKALLPNSRLLDFALMAIHTLLQFYSYIALIVAPAMVILSPFLVLIPGVKNASHYNGRTAEQKYADSLDANEQALNSLTGVGYLTNDQAYAAGKIDANEWAAGSILRDGKMDKFGKK